MRALGIALLCLAVSVAHADDKQEARAHVAKATEAHARGEYELALSELEVAYELDPMPALLFATAQLHVKLSRCKAAITYYRRFLDTRPGTQARLDTEQAIATCEQRIADAKASAPEATPPPPKATPNPTPPPKATPAPNPASPPKATSASPLKATSASPPNPRPVARRAPARAPAATPAPWYRDKLGGALVASGALAGVAGIVWYGRARDQLDDAEAARNVTDYRARVNDAHETRGIAIVLGVSSGLLLGAGIVRYALKRTPASEARLAIVPDRGGGGIVTYSGGF